MAVSFSIKNVPDHLAKKIRQKAAINHRSLQEELLVILNESVKGRRWDHLKIRSIVVY